MKRIAWRQRLMVNSPWVLGVGMLLLWALDLVYVVPPDELGRIARVTGGGGLLLSLPLSYLSIAPGKIRITRRYIVSQSLLLVSIVLFIVRLVQAAG